MNIQRVFIHIKYLSFIQEQILLFFKRGRFIMAQPLMSNRRSKCIASSRTEVDDVPMGSSCQTNGRYFDLSIRMCWYKLLINIFINVLLIDKYSGGQESIKIQAFLIDKMVVYGG